MTAVATAARTRAMRRGRGLSAVTRRTLPPPAAASTLSRVLLAYLHRLLWFAIAAAVGLLWAFSEQLTGKPLSIPGHTVLGTLFSTALATAGYNLQQLLAWRRELTQLSSDAGIPPTELRDAMRLLLTLHEGDPRRLRALRDAALRETRDEP